MSFWKDELAVRILDQKDIDYNWLKSLQSEFPSLRVKTVDAKGQVPVIQFGEKQPGLKPREWANNHVASLRQRYLESRQRLSDVGCDPSVISLPMVVPESELDSSKTNDLREVDELREKYDKIRQEYARIITLLKKVEQAQSGIWNSFDHEAAREIVLRSKEFLDR